MDQKFNKLLRTVKIIFSIFTLLAFFMAIPLAEMNYAASKKGYITTAGVKRVEIVEVAANSPAETAGLEAGDIITKAGGKEISTVEEYISFTNDNLGNEVTLTIKRGNTILNTTIVPRTEIPPNEGPTGIAIGDEEVLYHEQNRAQLITDALIKPYMGYESLPKIPFASSAIGLYHLLASLNESDYIYYEYTGNFRYLINLASFIFLLVTTVGIFKRKKYAAYMALIYGAYLTLDSLYLLLYNLIRYSSIDPWILIFTVFSLYILSLCLQLFSIRKSLK